jgi:hypothetical protein
MEVVADNFLSEQTGPYNEQDLQILEEADKQQQEEELIAGKFRSPDELLKAYQELEKKLGSRSGYDKAEEPSTDDTEEQEQEPAVLSQEEETTIMESIGGKDNFEAVQTWARENLDAAELEAYNREVNSGDYYRARNALQSLYYAYQDNAGYEPELIGGKISGRSTDVFRSNQEVMAAMSDPRYLQDPAYTQDVQDKLIRSDVLGPRG